MASWLPALRDTDTVPGHRGRRPGSQGAAAVSGDHLTPAPPLFGRRGGVCARGAVRKYRKGWSQDTLAASSRYFLTKTRCKKFMKQKKITYDTVHNAGSQVRSVRSKLFNLTGSFTPSWLQNCQRGTRYIMKGKEFFPGFMKPFYRW